MHTRPIVQATTVPSFRRRVLRLWRALRRAAVPATRTEIPDYLREDIGLSPVRRRRRTHAPPDDNPYWRI
jgi:hypothetical protein